MIVKSQSIHRYVMAAVTILAIAMALVLVGAHEQASANHVSPTLISGNQNCAAATGLSQVLRLEDNELVDGTYPVEAGSGTITIDVSSDLESVSWSSTGVIIAAVFVKGGPDGYLYDYRPAGATSDSGLISPPNPGNQDPTISHISFCVPATQPTQGPTSTDDVSDTGVSTTSSDDGTGGTQESDTTQSPSAATESTEEVSGPDETNSSTTSIVDDVLGTEVLPFTGMTGEGLGMFALALVTAGLLFMVAARGIER